MRCPFLKESPTRYCQAAPDRKIPSSGISAKDDLCSTPEYTSCPVARAGHRDQESKPSCPYLAEMLAQYCAAAPVMKFIPFSEQDSRCTTDAHHYCPLYLQRAHPGAAAPATGDVQAQPRRPARPGRNDGARRETCSVRVVDRLAYSPNHMWLDVAADGTCHVGLDAFAARVLGCADRVRFLRTTGLLCPAVSLEVHGVDLTMVFPRRILVGGCNAHLRTDPAEIEHDPYGAGWLFSGTYVDDLAGSAELIDGPQAAVWMRSEVDRMQHFVHDELPHTLPDGSTTAMDGGMWEAGLAQRLDHESLLRLYGSFLAPNMSWRSS